MTKTDARFEKWDKLYKTLLTPIAFISTLTFTLLFLMASLALQDPALFLPIGELEKLTAEMGDEEAKVFLGKEARKFLTGVLAFLSFGLFSIIASISFYSIAHVRFQIGGRWASFLFLYSSLIVPIFLIERVFFAPGILWLIALAFAVAVIVVSIAATIRK